MKFLTTRSPDASVGTMLVDSMKPAVAPGKVRIIALAQGDRVELAGRWFDVLWPPADLTAKPKSAITKTMAELDAVATELADHDLPLLRQTLEELRRKEKKFLPSRPGAGAGGENDEGPRCYRGADRAPGSRESQADDEFDMNSLLGDGHDNVDDPDIDMGEDDNRGEDTNALAAVRQERRRELLPVDNEKLQERVKKVFVRVRNLNNDLSLILLSQDNQTLLLGDAGKKVVDNVLGDPSVAWRLGHVHAMLAPHHGTQGLPKTLPASCHCIAQTGKHHNVKWGHNHKAHKARCVSLEDRGSSYRVDG